ncbi:TetR/AcrR family transcriptional regulator [Streptomyces sp. SID3343]|uniref:TetR/AcrR family transcriptional regulator n=1 Tax=Streptomyces sp. SID3343 TaxID=2690260 RepID=UPI0013700641|nr:TetR/AcrR family transcriptional regulator [Streptomyces sp. SID3343]MYV98185.1 TetR family transcriptional regulator [Streptomyces sp. SID3343]
MQPATPESATGTPADRPPAPLADPDKPRRGRPRSEEAERAILTATLRLLDEHRSIAAISVEAVAHEAGVGKATIYRRWPGKEALVVAAVEYAEVPLPTLAGVSLRDDLVTVLETLRLQAIDKRGDGLMGMVAGEMRQHPELHRRYHEVVVHKRRTLLRDLLQRAVDSGELRSDLPMDVLMDLVSGPILVRKLVRQDASLKPELPGQIADALLGGIRARS